MQDTRADIEFTQGDDWEQVVLFKDMSGVPVDMSDYTLTAEIKEGTADDAAPLGPIIVDGSNKSAGKFVFRMTKTASATATHEKNVWRVRAQHISGFAWTILWGAAQANEFRSGAATRLWTITLNDTPDVIQVTIGGLVGPSGGGSMAWGPFNQTVAAQTWVLLHNLGYYPSVTVVNEDGNVMGATIEYIDQNLIHIGFSQPKTGSAYLN